MLPAASTGWKLRSLFEVGTQRPKCSESAYFRKDVWLQDSFIRAEYQKYNDRNATRMILMSKKLRF